MKKYIPSQIEPKWQKKWKEEKLFSIDLDHASKPFYSLMMFPYPSAEGMHVGNMYAFTGSDVYSRFKRLQGFDVFEPIGLDGFGIHGENYALKINEHPMEVSKRTEKHFFEQFMAIGNAYDWDHTVESYKPDYYKWTQWAFLQLYKKGIAYRKKAEVNWCPSCKTVLADEQVIAGECERCASPVEKKQLEQWFFRITDYAERLLKNLEWIDWSEKIKVAQRNWIGKKEGINITYPVIASDPSAGGERGNLTITCFTTRPDTNFGATFIVIGPEHPFVALLLNSKFKVQSSKLKEIQEYVEKAKSKSETDRIAEGKKKTGVFTGYYVINNLNGKRLPVWISDFVLGNVGTGAVVGVPGHDIRDFQFAREFALPIIRVVVGSDGDTSAITEESQVQEKEGTMVNSEFLDGIDIHQATTKIMDFLEEKGWGKRVTTYHLRDWLISRQRYWGPPIPIIYCDKCGTVPVPEKDLPVVLPYIKDFRPTGKGVSPLASDPDFVNVKCPECSGPAKRETDVSDNFLDSALYYFRYLTTELPDKFFDEGRTEKWLPVDMYIGGAEHSVLHLLYSRFITMVFKDLGLIGFEEPFEKFRAHGLIIAEGAKMSKSKGNVVNPDVFIKEWGADTLRMYLMFMGPFTEGGDFRVASVSGAYRFLTRVWGLQDKISNIKYQISNIDQRIMHKTIKKVTEDMEQLRFNTAIAALMEWLNHLSRKSLKSRVESLEYETFLLLLAPFAPHITEELWQILHCHPEESSTKDLSRMRVSNELRPARHRFAQAIAGGDSSPASPDQNDNKNWSIHQLSWPKFDESQLVEEEISIAVQVNGKVRDVLLIQKDLLGNRDVVEKMALESEKIRKFLAGKSVKKIVYIPGKIISLVVRSE